MLAQHVLAPAAPTSSARGFQPSATSRSTRCSTKPFVVSRWRWGVFSLALLFLFGPGAVLAAPPPISQPSETPSVEERIQALEQAIEALRAELHELEQQRTGSQAGATAAGASGDLDDRIAELSRRLDLLAAELERLDLGATPAAATGPEHGFGPAASKIYRTDRGLSIGGYGEMLYQGFSAERDEGAPSEEKDRLDFLRAVFYFGYKFTDRLLFNSEVEFEHATTDHEGEVSVEFAYLDYLLRPEVNLRAGLLLIPVGFLNELHEPPVFLGARRPDVESAILPTTWAENGFGLFGDAGPVSYRTYIVNGFNAAGFEDEGLREGRQGGSEALAEDFAWVGRLDYTGHPGLLLGASLYTGGADQGLLSPDGRALDIKTTIYEGHLEWKWRGLELRALAARSKVDDVAALDRALGLGIDESVGEQQEGWYVQLGYDVFSRRSHGEKALIPFARYESFDTQKEVPVGFERNPELDVESLTVGLSFKPIDEVVFKADFQNFKNRAGTAVDQINVAIGYLF